MDLDKIAFELEERMPSTHAFSTYVCTLGVEQKEETHPYVLGWLANLSPKNEETGEGENDGENVLFAFRPTTNLIFYTRKGVEDALFVIIDRDRIDISVGDYGFASQLISWAKNGFLSEIGAKALIIENFELQLPVIPRKEEKKEEEKIIVEG